MSEPSSPPADARDAHFMRLALAQAQAGAQVGEVPIGAVLVNAAGQVLAAAHNAPIALCDPTAHAEVLALRQGAQALGNYRLDGCTLYVTAEPCAMCAGAALHARLARVVYATPEPKTGAAGSQINVFAQPALNAHTTVQGGVLAEDAQALLRTFFSQQRQRAQAHRPPRLRDDAVRAPSAAFQAPFHTLGWPSHVTEWPADGSAPAPAEAANGALQAFGHAITLDEATPSNPTQRPSTQRPTAWRMHAVHRAPPALPSDAPAVLLLHGWADHGWVWRDWAQALNGRGWRVLVPDLLGAGQSDKPKRTDRLSHADVAHALHLLLARLHWHTTRQRVLVADASLAPWLAHSAVTQSASAVLWWQAPAIGAQAGQKPCTANTPQDPLSLSALLPDVNAPHDSDEYEQSAARKQAAIAPYPDKGHLTMCRSRLQALCARPTQANPAQAQAQDLNPGQGQPPDSHQHQQVRACWLPGQARPSDLDTGDALGAQPALIHIAGPLKLLRDAPAFGRIWPWSPAAAQWFADLA